jgi:hypothetical protein
MTDITYQPARASELDPRGEIHMFIGMVNAPDSLKTCLEAEGCFSPGVGSYGIYLWLYDRDQQALAAPTMAGVPSRRGLSPEGYLIPWVEWQAFGVAVRGQYCSLAQPSPAGEATVTALRLRLTSHDSAPRRLRLFVALRPLGPAGYDVRALAVDDQRLALLADGHPAVVGPRPADAAGVSASDRVGEYARAGAVPPAPAATSPTGDCSGALAYDLTLPAGEAAQFEFIFPVLPGRRAPSHRWDGITAWFQLDLARPQTEGALQPDPGLAWYRSLSADALVADAFHYWEARVGTARLDLPDPRWGQFVRAAAGHFGMMLNDDAPDLAPVNLNVFNRDLSYMTNLLETIGDHRQAETFLRWYLRFPFSGRVEPEADNPGQILWTLADHWRFTRDTAFVREVYPAVRQLCALIRYLRTTPEPHYVYDDTFAFGEHLPPERRKRIRPGACDGTHPEYTEAFDIAGLRHAATLAEVAGAPEDAAAWRALADELFERYDRAFAGDLGREYGSYAVLWPCRLYRFDDPRVVQRFGGIGRMDSTTWRYFPLATAHQGLFAGSRAAGYATIASHLDEEQMQGWYVLDEGGPSGVGGWPALRTTWSCALKRPDWAPLSAIAMPDGWGIAELWRLMRDSLVYEYDDRLVLFSGIDPAWFAAPEPWAFSGLPTWYGSLACRWRYRGRCAASQCAELHLAGGAAPPGGFVLRLPESMRGATIQVRPTGAAVLLGPGSWVLPAETDLALVEW